MNLLYYGKTVSDVSTYSSRSSHPQAMAQTPMNTPAYDGNSTNVRDTGAGFGKPN